MGELWGQAGWTTMAGMWVGFAVALIVFSTIFGDHWLARFGQHVLVGAALGYAAVVTWQTLATLPFIQDLAAAPRAAPWNWIPIVLALLLAIAALERVFFQGEPGQSPAGWRRGLRWLGLAPAALLVSVTAAIVTWGILQGTLAPQFWRAAQIGFAWEQPPVNFLTGLLMLLLTVAALLFFAVEPQHLAGQPGFVQRFMRGWLWVGQRAVWLAAGVIFARLFVSRVSLLAAQFEFFRATLASTGIWQAIETWWRSGASG